MKSHTLFARVLAALALTLSSVPLHAEKTELTLEERLSRLESAITRIEQRLNATVSVDELAPTLKEYSDLTKALGWDGKSPLTAVKLGGKEKSLSLGGFVHANFESGGTKPPDARFVGINNRFLLRRARIYVAGTFAEDISFRLETDFGANSLSNKTGLSGQFTDAYIAWTKIPKASLRIGQFKTPFGYEQLVSDPKLISIERSLANDRLTIGRQVGAMLYGDVVGKRATYSLGAFNGTGTNNSINDNQKFLWAGRITGVLVDTKSGANLVKLTVGANYFTTTDKANTTLATTFTGRREGTGLDAQFVYGPAEFHAEWLDNNLHPVTGIATKADGWAVLGAYNVTPKWQGMVRYESYDSNAATLNTTTKLWTFGINYRLKGDDLKLSLDYLSGQQPAPASQGDRIIGRLQVMF